MKIENIKELKAKFPAATEYLSQIYLIKRDYGQVSNARLAERLGISRAAVSQGMGRLKKIGYIIQNPYGNITLSEEGILFAESIIRRHYLIEHMLINLLDYPWEKTDTEAELLQDVLSPALTIHLRKKLGFPQSCPHGNPMPGAEDEQARINAPDMTRVASGSAFVLLRITEEGERIEGLLAFCQQYNLKPGYKAVLTESTREYIMINKDGTALEIPFAFARHIRIQIIQKEEDQ